MNGHGKAEIFVVDPDGKESQLNGVIYAAVTITQNNPPTALIKCAVDQIDLEAEVEA